MSNIILFPIQPIEDEDPGSSPGQAEYDPNDPGVDMSAYLAAFNRLSPDYDRRVPNADELPF